MMSNDDWSEPVFANEPAAPLREWNVVRDPEAALTVKAERLEVIGGAAVFLTAGEIEYVFSPQHYQYIVRL